MNEIKKKLGTRIRELRNAYGRTQEFLAEKVHIETSSLSNIENGKTYPSANTIEHLTEAFQILPHELFIFEHLQRPPVNILIREMNEAFQSDSELVYMIYNVFKSIIR